MRHQRSYRGYACPDPERLDARANPSVIDASLEASAKWVLDVLADEGYIRGYARSDG